LSADNAYGFAFLFPGQGSQTVGMLGDLLASETVVADTFTEASEALGYDMRQLVADNPGGKLDQTEFTQPALLTCSTALLRLWLHRGGPEAIHAAGHSLGEYSALVAAGSLSFTDAVSLVAFRGRAMSEAVPAGVGLMAAILGLDDTTIEALCDEASTADSKVWPANYNCPGQLVVAGNAAAVERLIELAKGAGAKRAMPLQVSAPSHTPLMQPAADRLQQRLAAVPIDTPAMPVWSNALAAALTDAEAIRSALVSQLVSPVRWSETIHQLFAQGAHRAVEMGPGKVLSGIARRVERDMEVHATDGSEAMDKAILAVQQATTGENE
jgi:[acyl-carrier-protein] S-malonyltransferase